MAQQALKTGWEFREMPPWVPEAVRHYLAHVEGGLTIRELARRTDVHASTVLRQIRRIERRRDDPLVDGALRRLADQTAGPVDGFVDRQGKEGPEEVSGEVFRVLRRLCESGATLAVARDMDRAVVVRDDAAGEPARTAMVERATAEVLALRDLIDSNAPEARIARYKVTAAGRAELRMLMAASENAARGRETRGLGEARASFEHGAAPEPRGLRTALAESPLVSLSRRRDKDGKPFLGRALVAAGERLREDFELAQLEGEVPDWSQALHGENVTPLHGEGGRARARVAAALADLGPGLGDVALRCCCRLEGMEETERRLGWSARSGKIVLRIALQRLKVHYDSQPSPRIG